MFFVLFFAFAFSSMIQHILDMSWVYGSGEWCMEQAVNSEALRLYLLVIAKGSLEHSSHLWVSLGPKAKAFAPNSSA